MLEFYFSAEPKQIDESNLKTRNEFNFINKFKAFSKVIDYKPSYKFYQKKLDYRVIGGNSISLGRGYFCFK